MDEVIEKLDHKQENLPPSLIGSAVDYLARLADGASPRESFRISLLGASRIGIIEQIRATAIVARLSRGRVDPATIRAACKLASYDVGIRAGRSRYNRKSLTSPDSVTVEHIAKMVARSVEFFRLYGPTTLAGFTFASGFTKTVSSGDGDFLTANTLWDFKVSSTGPTKDHTLQLLMYYLMGRRSGQRQFASITHLGIYNPRLNIVYRMALADISIEVLAAVNSKVIGYK